MSELAKGDNHREMTTAVQGVRLTPRSIQAAKVAMRQDIDEMVDAFLDGYTLSQPRPQRLSVFTIDKPPYTH